LSDTGRGHVRRFGEGARRVLALHCSLSHGGIWRGVAEHLAREVTLIAPDLPGHGKSPDWDGVADFQDACLAAVHPLLDGYMDVVGHSFAATVALRLAQEHPGRVRRLCLIEPVLFAAARMDDPAAFAGNTEASRGFRAALAEGDMALAARLFNRLWGDGRPWETLPPHTRAYITERMRIIPGQDASLVDDRAGLLAPERLARVGVPVLLRGDRSPPVTAAINAALAARLPEAREAVIAGAGHMAPLTHPQEVAGALRAFLRSG
jgi:pimeloyl-ACP methyl ester carboxylesterase